MVAALGLNPIPLAAAIAYNGIDRAAKDRGNIGKKTYTKNSMFDPIMHIYFILRRNKANSSIKAQIFPATDSYYTISALICQVISGENTESYRI